MQELHFWRTLAKNEVDFVVVKGKDLRPVEVKYSAFSRPKIPSGITRFQQEYGSEKGIVLTKDYFSATESALFLPVWLG